VTNVASAQVDVVRGFYGTAPGLEGVIDVYEHCYSGRTADLIRWHFEVPHRHQIRRNLLLSSSSILSTLTKN
jgi:hypothetical protein